MPESTGATIIDLATARKRRHYIDLARASQDWHNLKGSFAISGIELTDDDAERIGRMIARAALVFDPQIEHGLERDGEA